MTAPRHGVLYPNVYVWFVFLAAMDIMCTYMIMHPGLFHHTPSAEAVSETEVAVELVPRGEELNVVADWVIRNLGTSGKVVYKFTLVMLVVGICEFVGRHDFRLGRRLARIAVVLTAVPVLYAVVQMVRDIY